MVDSQAVLYSAMRPPTRLSILAKITAQQSHQMFYGRDDRKGARERNQMFYRRDDRKGARERKFNDINENYGHDFVSILSECGCAYSFTAGQG